MRIGIDRSLWGQVFGALAVLASKNLDLTRVIQNKNPKSAHLVENLLEVSFYFRKGLNILLDKTKVKA